MGVGRYKDGKFDLILSIRHNADAPRIEQWERSFKRASEILYDATDGQMQFGRIYVANNNVGSSEADAYLLEEEGTSSSSVNALGTPGLHMNLKGDERNKPYIVIHEFGHYGLGVYDEYTGPSGGAECTGNSSSGACIMEFAWTLGDQISDDGTLTLGTVNEFCTDEDHDPDGDTNQESVHGESCWQTIKDNYPDVNIPIGLPDAPTPAGHELVEWILLNAVPRFALVLDKSGSMSDFNAIDGVRYGAEYWVNNLAVTGDQLSVVAYNQTQQVVLPLTLLSPGTDLSPPLSAIAALSASGTTNIGSAMVEGVAQITSPGDRAATQVMILFSDGLHNTGISPESVINQLVENGIRAYTIGFGANADQALLQEIAEATGGRFEQIDAATADTPDAQLEIQNYLIEISGEVRDGSGIITMAPGLLPEPSVSGPEIAIRQMKPFGHTSDDLQQVAKIPFQFRVRSGGFDHRAYVEQGSSRATFIVSHQQGTDVQFYLFRPDGQVVNPTDSGVTFVNPERSPYAFYVVKNPASGFWVMRVMRGQTRGTIPFKVFAFSENKALNTGIQGIASLYRPTDAIFLKAQVYYQVPLTGLRNPVVRAIPRDYVRKQPQPDQLPKVTLEERPVKVGHSNDSCHHPARLANGVYQGELNINDPGSYLFEVEFVNAGKASESVAEAEPPVEGDRQDPISAAPAFMRTKRFQIHVGPLPRGRDVESAPTNFWEKLCSKVRSYLCR